jgi:hypothetical protein
MSKPVLNNTIRKYRVTVYKKTPAYEYGYVFYKKHAEFTKELNLDQVIKDHNLIVWRKNKKDWLMRNPDVYYLKNDKYFYSFEIYKEMTQEQIDKLLEGL